MMLTYEGDAQDRYHVYSTIECDGWQRESGLKTEQTGGVLRRADSKKAHENSQSMVRYSKGS
jgi:hypothetical protein